MSKNNENENVHVERQDNTQVRRPVLQKRFQKASPAKQIESYLQIYGVPQQPVLSSDTRTPEQKEANRKAGELEIYRQKEEEQKQTNRQLALGLGTTAAVIGSQFTPAAPWVNAAIAANSGVNLAVQHQEGTLGFNTETALNTIGVTFPGFKYIGKWRPFLPKGTPTTVYRQGNPEMLDDYLKSGMVRPISKELVDAKRAQDASKSNGSKKLISLIRKDFSNDLMFNREYPFYGNPFLFDNHSYKVVVVGDMNKSSAIWKQRFHKGHKNIVEPYMGDVKQAPLSEFDIYTRAPFGFGWFKNLKTGNKPVSSSIVQSQNTEEYLYTPDELVKSGDFAKGKEMAVKFFEHPVVQQSYKHNQELAKRLGITVPDKNAAEVVKQPVKISYKKLDNEIANVAQSHYGDPDAVITMDWAMYPLKDLRQAVIHENLHRGFYGAPLRLPTMSKDYYTNIYKPEYKFWEWKTKKLLKPEYHNGYLSDIHGGEAGTNFIDLGRDLGLKLGQKYPGYETVKAMLENYKGFKRFMIPQLNTSKAGMRHVWDAMTGKYFTPTAITAGIMGSSKE